MGLVDFGGLIQNQMNGQVPQLITNGDSPLQYLGRQAGGPKGAAVGAIADLGFAALDLNFALMRGTMLEKAISTGSAVNATGTALQSLQDL